MQTLRARRVLSTFRGSTWPVLVDVGERIDWGSAPVLDKHCIGGLPGNRTTLLVVPIAAACGVLMPKTSSRAITSAAGTADAMETLAPVALDLAAMRRVVEREGGCIVGGGATRISPADDVLISVERPLSLDTREQMVASIMSKKIAAGSTHLLIDIPVGPTAKVTTAVEAMRLRKLFEFVGDRFGRTVEVITTDGRQPIGNGIGPVLEANDVMAVLGNDPDAPRDLREKSLRLAAHLLEYDPKLRGGAGYARARELEPAALAVAWCRDHPAVTSPIVGARNAKQIETALLSCDIRLTPEQRAEISALSPEPPLATDREPLAKTHIPKEAEHREPVKR